MNIWLLRPIDGHEAWEPWFDKAFGFVVRAENEETARSLAASQAGDEGRGQNSPWLDPSASTCVVLQREGNAEVIIMDFYAA